MNSENYNNWKKWETSSFGVIRPGSLMYFKSIFNKHLKNARNTLEIGFGNGELLTFFRECGCDVVGVEINDVLVERAIQHGIPAYSGMVWNLDALRLNKFSLIVAIDVIEHMNFEQLMNLFKWVGSHLTEGGKFIIRFPECSSPFGLANQHGDFTHVSALSKPKIEMLCKLNGLALISYKDDVLSSNFLCSYGIVGRFILTTLHAYSYLLKIIIRALLRPIAPNVIFATNSIATIVNI